MGLFVHDQNLKARALYHSIGFETYSVRMVDEQTQASYTSMILELP